MLVLEYDGKIEQQFVYTLMEMKFLELGMDWVARQSLSNNIYLLPELNKTVWTRKIKTWFKKVFKMNSAFFTVNFFFNYVV